MAHKSHVEAVERRLASDRRGGAGEAECLLGGWPEAIALFEEVIWLADEMHLAQVQMEARLYLVQAFLGITSASLPDDAPDWCGMVHLVLNQTQGARIQSRRIDLAAVGDMTCALLALLNLHVVASAEEVVEVCAAARQYARKRGAVAGVVGI